MAKSLEWYAIDALVWTARQLGRADVQIEIMKADADDRFASTTRQVAQEVGWTPKGPPCHYYDAYTPKAPPGVAPECDFPDDPAGDEL